MSIGYVGSASAGFTANTTFSVTYSPTAGNTVIVFLGGNGAFNPTVKDSSNVTLTAGLTETQTVIVHSAYYTAGSGVTSFTATWTGTARAGNIVVIEYSGVNTVNATLSGNVGSGVSNNHPTLTCTTLNNNAWLVAGFGVSATTSWTAATGNLRIGVIGSETAGRIGVVDNTSSVAGSVTCAATTAGTSTWAGVVYELDSVSGGGAVIRELNLLGVGV